MSTLNVKNLQGISPVNQVTVPTGHKLYAPGHVVQVQSVTVNTVLSGTLGASTNPAYNSGTSYTTLSFTPVFSSSKLWLTTSPICIEETSNIQDDFWLAAFYDTTRIACCSGSPSYVHFATNLNVGWYSLNVLFNSWGTSTKTIDFRIGAGSTGTNMYVNNSYNSMDTSARNYGFTVVEIAA